jgi:hypothetical protein
MRMSNDERVDALNKRLKVTLEYSDDIKNRQAAKPNKSKLQKLAHKIRKELEDIPIEAAVHGNPSR